MCCALPWSHAARSNTHSLPPSPPHSFSHASSHFFSTHPLQPGVYAVYEGQQVRLSEQQLQQQRSELPVLPPSVFGANATCSCCRSAEQVVKQYGAVHGQRFKGECVGDVCSLWGFTCVVSGTVCLHAVCGVCLCGYLPPPPALLAPPDLPFLPPTHTRPLISTPPTPLTLLLFKTPLTLLVSHTRPHVADKHGQGADPTAG